MILHSNCYWLKSVKSLNDLLYLKILIFLGNGQKNSKWWNSNCFIEMVSYGHVSMRNYIFVTSLITKLHSLPQMSLIYIAKHLNFSKNHLSSVNTQYWFKLKITIWLELLEFFHNRPWISKLSIFINQA